MGEWEPEVQRISRHQVTLREELEALAEHTEQAQAWAASVGALGRISHLPSPAPPTGLEAELRPYQHEGYAWLSLLYDHRLGGDRKSTRLNSSHVAISYAVFCLKKKNRSTLT